MLSCRLYTRVSSSAERQQDAEPWREGDGAKLSSEEPPDPPRRTEEGPSEADALGRLRGLREREWLKGESAEPSAEAAPVPSKLLQLSNELVVRDSQAGGDSPPPDPPPWGGVDAWLTLS